MQQTRKRIVLKRNRSTLIGNLLIFIILCVLFGLCGFVSATIYHMIGEHKKTQTVLASEFMTLKRAWLDENCTLNTKHISKNPAPSQNNRHREVLNYDCPSPNPDLGIEKVIWTYLHGDF